MFFGNLFELGNVEQTSELIKVKHVVVLAVFTKERDVLAEVHVLKVIGDKTSVAALYAFTKFGEDLFLVFHFTSLGLFIAPVPPDERKAMPFRIALNYYSRLAAPMEA
jgi:hypothetical protein